MMLPVGLKKLLFRDYLVKGPRVRQRLGCRWLLDYRNHVDRKIILGKRFEAHQIVKLTALVRELRCDLFIDVGANFGLYAVLLGRSCPELKQICAIEPQARNYQQLCANVFLNGLSDLVRPIQAGASSHRCTAKFLENVANHTGMSRLAETAPAETNRDNFREVEVLVDRLDAMVEPEEGARIALKVDVEGHELEVLAGASELLQNFPCVIQMEILGEQQVRVRQLCKTFDLVLREVIDCDHYFVNRAMLQGEPTTR